MCKHLWLRKKQKVCAYLGFTQQSIWEMFQNSLYVDPDVPSSYKHA